MSSPGCVGGDGDVGDGLIGRPLCMMLSGQSRLAEVHLWLYRLCWNDRVVTEGESVMDFKTKLSDLLKHDHR